MKRKSFFHLFVLVIAFMPIPLFANDDVPHEKKGFQESGYALSQYENINLANGNLTYHVPLYTLRTDGGLEYPLTAFYNMKTWYTHPYCTLTDFGYEFCNEAGGEVSKGEVADGIEAYGFGWDLRPPRVIEARVTPKWRRRAIVDASGARHLLHDDSPWGSPDSPDFSYTYTADGTNYRLTKVTPLQGRATEIRMEDGHGSVYIFKHIVPDKCDANLNDPNPSVGLQLNSPNLEHVNFKVSTAGLYLSEIQRGPWRQSTEDGGEPENKITFEYKTNALTFADDCNEQWLVKTITAHGAPGEVDRSVTFNYALGTINVLQSITIPTFDPTLGSHAESPNTFDIGWVTEAGLFSQTNGTNSFNFTARKLTGIDLPEGLSFGFSQTVEGFINSVALPSGATVDYYPKDFPLGFATWVQSYAESEDWKVVRCGIDGASPGVEPNGEANLAGGPPMKSPGVGSRTITYADASSVPSETRQETTIFSQGMSCVAKEGFDNNGNNSQWPYYFDPFLRDDRFLLTEYLFTVVSLQPGFSAPGGVGDPAGTGATSAEIHRFHPLTREEFSVDYVTGPPDSIKNLHAYALSDGYREGLDELGIRVLRHAEIRKGVLQDIADNKRIDNENEELFRYTFTTQQRTFTDTETSYDQQDVGNCYPMVTPGTFLGGTQEPYIDCTELRQTTDPANVDDYYNILMTTIESFNAPSGLYVSRTFESSYGYGNPSIVEDPYVWVLGLKNGEQVTENTVTSRKAYFWKNLSDIPTSNDVQRYYVLGKQTVNPREAFPTHTDCFDDCIHHEYLFDDLGNLTGNALSGGSGTGFVAMGQGTTTTTTYSHGRAVKKELLGGNDTMLLWEREVDPSTGLTRWHVDGAGIGFAYLYDGAGRFTDIAPVDGDDSGSRGAWSLSLQEINTGLEATPMAGSHIEYVPPSAGVLLKHKVYDVYDQALDTELDPGTYAAEDLRNTFRFDGLGKLSQETEAYPQGTRSRFHVSYLHGGSELCDEDNPGWDLVNKSRVSIDSEWFDDGDLPGGYGFPGCPTSADWAAWTETQLDGLGRPGKIHGPDGSILKYEYGGDVIKVMTRSIADDLKLNGDVVLNEFTTMTVSDAFGRLRRLEEEVSKLPAVTYDTTYNYNERDQLTDVLLHNTGETAAQNRSFTYWETGFLKASCEPERRLFLQGYDAAGNLNEEFTEFTSTMPLTCEYDPMATGVTVDHTFDDFGRLINTKEGLATIIEQTWGNPHGGGGVLIGWPSYNKVVESTRHNTFETDIEVTHQWTYNAPGARPRGRKTLISGVGAIDDGFQIDYAYDIWGNQHEVAFPYFNGCRYSNWEMIENTFDGTWMTDTHLKAFNGARKIIGHMEYHPSGRIDTLTYGSTAPAFWKEITDPDLMARPEQIQLWINGSANGLGTTGTYAFDGVGNVWKIGSKRYSYDGLSRIEKYSLWEENVRTLSFQEGYSFDRWGNMTAIDQVTSKTNATLVNYLTFNLEDVDNNGVPDSNRIASVNNTSKASVALWWDDRGNLEQQGAIADLMQKEYLWTYDDRLKESINDPNGTPTVWRFAYDTAGERVMKWYDNPAGLEAKIFIRDEGGQVLSEWDYTSGGGSFDVARDYVNAGARTVAQIDHSGASESVGYFSADHLGSTRVVFNDAGALLDTMEYLPFGAFDEAVIPPDTPNTTHLFTGHERDLGTTSSELDYMHARYYSPTLARFVSVDPVGGKVGSSQSWNRYSYVLNNPIILVDPNGKFEFAPAAGSGFGRDALNFYAAVIADPTSNSFQKGASYVLGAIAASWTPETSNRTGIALASGGTALLGVRTGVAAVHASMKVGAVIGGLTSSTNSALSGNSAGQIVFDGVSGAMTGAAMGRIPTNPLTGFFAGGGGNMVSQLSNGNNVDMKSVGWSSFTGLVAGTVAIDDMGTMQMIVAGGVVEIGEVTKIVAEYCSSLNNAQLDTVED